MRGMLIVAVALGGLAVGAAFMALPEVGARGYNADVRQACAEIRGMRPSADCSVPPRRDALDMQWLLIAAVLGVGAAGVFAVSRRG